MTDAEIALLALGVTLGILLMTVANTVCGIIETRRDLHAARAARQQTLKYRATDDWRAALRTRERT